MVGAWGGPREPVVASESWAARGPFGQYRGEWGGEFFGGAEVEGALASILAIDEAVVGAEAAGAAGAVGGDHGADAGENGDVSADEVEGRFGHIG